ncbi:AbrB/MazE/SpoVT family DNA-binding domain-containing protein [Candidatus Micrarchaeota archaeon]|nr:AbrB/MazE/SpoVT family DNA-binding domain-containing protein [Candidatus Micrarchaeota archaeon]
MSFVSKAISVGGSLMVTIPKELAKVMNIHPNEPVEIEVKKVKLSGFGMFRGTGLTPFAKDDELHLHD